MAYATACGCNSSFEVFVEDFPADNDALHSTMVNEGHACEDAWDSQMIEYPSADDLSYERHFSGAPGRNESMVNYCPEYDEELVNHHRHGQHVNPHFDPLEMSKRVAEDSRSARNDSACDQSWQSAGPLNRAAIYEMCERDDKARFLYDGENMIKIAPKRYTALLKTMGRNRLAAVMKRINQKLNLPTQPECPPNEVGVSYFRNFKQL